MLIIFVYLVAVVTWGWILFDLVKLTVISIKHNTDTPRLLIPLAAASLGLFVESLYFLIANFVRYVLERPEQYMLFLQQDQLFVIKLFIALSGLFMLLKMKSEGKK
jgi:hypothetical protein